MPSSTSCPGPVASYDRHGFGLFLVELKESRAPIGICGLLKRDARDDVDIGFAFVPESWSKGYAFESTTATLPYAHAVQHLKRIVAITSSDKRRVDQPAGQARLLLRAHGADARRQD